jgi:hypothetical protein
MRTSKPGIANATAESGPDIEITATMVAAGEDVILCEVGGAADLGGAFSAADLARKVYLAMRGAAVDPCLAGPARKRFDARSD